MPICTRAEVETWLGITTTITEGERGLLNMLLPSAEAAVKKYIGYDPVQATRTEYYPLGPFRHSDDEAETIDVQGGVAVFQGTRYDDNILILNHLPVRSITTLYEDRDARAGQGSNPFPAGSLLTAGTQYYLDLTASGISKSGFVYRVGSGWPNVPGSVKITYVAGYSAQELAGQSTDGPDASDLKMATVLTVAKAFATAKTIQAGSSGSPFGVLASENLGDYGYSVDAMSASRLFGMLDPIPQEAKTILHKYMHYGKMVA